MNNFNKYYKTNFHIHLTGAFNLNNNTTFNESSFFDKESWEDKKDFLTKEENLFKSICHVGKNESLNKVKYIEVTINCLGLLKRGMTKEKIKLQLVKAHNYCKLQHNIFIVYKIGINRKDNIDESLEMVDLFEYLPKEILVCIDINGNERKRPDYNLHEIYKKSSEKRIPLSIHAGEYLGLNLSVQKAFACSPKRLAHLYSSVENQEQIKTLKRQHILVEVCPISTISMNPITSKIYKTQIYNFIKNKINFVIGTDDSIFFNNSINEELDFLEQSCKLSEWTILKIINYGLLESKLSNRLNFIIYNIFFYFLYKGKNVCNQFLNI